MEFGQIQPKKAPFSHVNNRVLFQDEKEPTKPGGDPNPSPPPGDACLRNSSDATGSTSALKHPICFAD